MNPAWVQRAEARIERLERIAAELLAVLNTLKQQPAEPEATKRGPGRPKKAE